MSASVTESHVSANPGSDMPIQLQCASSMGTYSLICSLTSISLYNVGEERYEWRQQITQLSLSRFNVNTGVREVSFSDINGSGCPGMSIETTDGRRIGIYAEEGVGFILYDYSAQKSLGICPFAQLSLSRIRLGTGVGAISVSTYTTGTDGSAIQLLFKNERDETIADIQFYSVGILYRSSSLEKRISWQQLSLSRFAISGFTQNVRFTVSESSFGVVFMTNDTDGYVLLLPVNSGGKCELMRRNTTGDHTFKSW